MEKCSFSLFSKHKDQPSREGQLISKSLISHGFTPVDVSPSLIIVLGGDGSLLKAMRLFDYQGHFVMVNTGHLGFFADYSLREVDALINDILTKEPALEKIPLFQMTTLNNNKTHLFLNDVAFQAQKTLVMEISINGIPFTQAQASGIVVGSGTASTGYLSSLGCPVMINLPTAFTYSLMAPIVNRLHPLTIDKATLSEKDTLTISVRHGRADVFIDGFSYPGPFSQEYRFCKDKDRFASLAHFRPMDQLKRIEQAYGQLKNHEVDKNPEES